MRKFLTCLSISAFLCLASCEKEQRSGAAPALGVDRSEISVSKDGGVEILAVKSNCYWSVEASGTDGRPVTWVKFSESRGSGDREVSITIAANIAKSQRTAIVKVSSPSSSSLDKTVTIVQAEGDGVSSEGYSFPICQDFKIDSPKTHMLTNGVISANECVFEQGMTVTWLKSGGVNERNDIKWYCPSHTQPASGTEADKSIHRSLLFGIDDNSDPTDTVKFAQYDTIQLEMPVKDALFGDLRLMCGARAASFTAPGWGFYWSSDGESWNKILVDNAVTPGSDAVWNIVYFTVPEASKVPAGGKLGFRFVAEGKRSKTYVCISNAICICPAKAPLSSLPPMDADKMAFSHGFDDLADCKGAYAELPIGWMCSATTGYASNFTSFNNQYVCPDSLDKFLSTKGCYGRPGYLQVGYYDESLWTRQCIGRYVIRIGERLKVMGVASADAKLSLKAAVFNDFRGYAPLADLYVKCEEDSTTLDMTIGKFENYEVDLKGVNQKSEIIISCPKLNDVQIAGLDRGANVNNLLDYRFYIDDVKVELTTIHEHGTETGGGHSDFTDGGNYNW